MAQSAKDFLVAEATKKLAEATRISDEAAEASRALTEDERDRVKNLISEATHFKTRVQDIEDNEALREQIDAMRGPVNRPTESGGGEGRTIGDAFVKSSAYQGLREGFKSGSLTGKWSSGAVELPDFGRKTVLDSTSGLTPEPDRQGGIRLTPTTQLRRLTIEDLLMQGTTSSSSIKYLRESAHTNAAAAVAEGGQKPESAFTFDEVDEPVRKVATFLPVTDEMLEDESQLRSYLDGRLRVFVEHAKEAQILSGSGTAPNLSGLMDRTGVQTATRVALGTQAGNTGTAILGDALFMAITNIRTNALVEPDGIVMHPTNWAQLRLTKDDNGQGYAGGPFTGPYGNGEIRGDTLWGLPVVTTTAMTLNTALVGAFGSQAQVFYRNGLTVEASNSHADFFQYNKTAIRAEQRLALAVYRPEAFHIITALQTSAIA